MRPICCCLASSFATNLIASSSNPGYSAGYIRLEGGLDNTSFLEWEVNGYGFDSGNPTYGAVGMVTASLGSLRSSSAANPFNNGESIILKIVQHFGLGMVNSAWAWSIWPGHGDF